MITRETMKVCRPGIVAGDIRDLARGCPHGVENLFNA